MLLLKYGMMLYLEEQWSLLTNFLGQAGPLAIGEAQQKVCHDLPTYGSWPFWAAESPRFEKVGKLVVEIIVCNNILHDIPVDIRLTNTYPGRPKPLLQTDTEVGEIGTMAVIALEAPYRVPARLDFDRIETLLGAKVASAKHHIWQLREDPGHFTEQLHETMAHRQEMIKRANGQAHHVCSSRLQNMFRSRVLGDLVANAYIELETFAELHKQAVQLRDLHSKYELGDNLFLMRMPFVVDELERLLEAEPTARNLVSAHISVQIGNLSITSHVRLSAYGENWDEGLSLQAKGAQRH